ACATETGWTCLGVTCSASCGDTLLRGLETCDDGNEDSNDGCSSTCEPEHGYECSGEPSVCEATCGDGLVGAPAEGCDDGSLDDGDGCSSSCAVEVGWSCADEPSDCETGCGDDIVAGPEGCDDGNLLPSDGCTATCQPEHGYI